MWSRLRVTQYFLDSVVARRLADRTRWPRALWHPLYVVPADPDEAMRAEFRDASATIQKLIFGILGAAVFCVTTLGKSDKELLTNEAEIAVPFTGVKIDYAGFLFVAPLVLIVFNAYLQLFIERWFRIRLTYSAESVAYFFNMRTPVAGIMTHFLFYWVVPVALVAFMFKALPHPWTVPVIWVGSCGILMNLGLLVRRTLGKHRLSITLLYWTLAGFVVYLACAATFDAGGGPLQRVIQLYKADLSGREIIGFHLDRADMRRVKLPGADLRCSSLTGANVIRGNLRESNLYRANFAGAILLSADLRGAALLKANFSGANLGSADLSGARTRDVLPEADQNLAHLTNWLDDTLTVMEEPRPVLDTTACAIAWDRVAAPEEAGARSPLVREHPGLLEREDIVQFMFAPDRFLYGYFSEANLRGANLERGDFRMSLFIGADLSAARLARGTFAYSIFTDALLRESQLREADLTGARFQNADLSGADLRGANLRDTYFGGADLSDADLRGARNLTRTQLARAARLEGAKFDAALGYDRAKSEQ